MPIDNKKSAQPKQSQSEPESLQYPGLPIRQTPKGVELYVQVTPKASETRIDEITSTSKDEYALKVYVNAPPENNQANKAVTEVMAKEIKIPKSCVTVVSGHTCRSKTLLLEGVDAVRVAEFLRSL